MDDDTERVAWLARRLTFGPGLTELVKLGEISLDDMISLVFTPSAPTGGPWDELEVPRDISLNDSIVVIDSWLDYLAGSATPLGDWTTWFWHDHFAVSATKIGSLAAFARHIELLAAEGAGSFRELIRAVTVDPAMLIFLDGRRNRVGAVNENYGRELLELYTLGVGNYDEADVRAAAVALTGWVWNDDLDDTTLVPRRHDPTPQSLLGSTVDDLDSVIDVITSHSACAAHLAGRMGEAVLGQPLPPDDLTALASNFRSNGLDVSTLVSDLIDLALDGASTPIVMQPVQWFLQAEAMTGAELDPRQRLFALRQMGQVPGVPPNVGGYPDALTWSGPSTTVGRFRAATLIAGQAPDDSRLLDRVRERDWDSVAMLTARPDGFSAETRAALNDANTTRRNGREALAALLMSPELAVA